MDRIESYRIGSELTFLIILKNGQDIFEGSICVTAIGPGRNGWYPVKVSTRTDRKALHIHKLNI